MNQPDWASKIRSLRGEGSLEACLDFLKPILDQNPKDPLIHYHMAWTYDTFGKESDAVGSYEKAIALGISGEDLVGAYVGLGSTLRCLGDYQKSKKVFENAIREFPDDGALKVFFSLTLYNLAQFTEAMEVLVKEIVRSSGDVAIKKYERALLFYAEKLDETFE